MWLSAHIMSQFKITVPMVIGVSRFDMEDYRCPHCGRPVKILKYGHGWVGMCCDRIVYNAPKPYEKGYSRPAVAPKPPAGNPPDPIPGADNVP